MRKILIIGDSSVPPRKELKYNKIYSTKLKKILANYIIEIFGKTGNSSRKIYFDLEPFTFYGYNPNIVILNYGIVDVYPRPYPNFIYRLLSCSGLLTYVDRFLKKTNLYYSLGNLFNFKEVKLENFKIYSEGIVKKLLKKDVEKIIIIGVIKPYRILLKSKIIDSEIKKYNDVFKELSLKYEQVDYIDIYNDSDEDFTIWDGYHYSEKASSYIVEKIKKIINA